MGDGDTTVGGLVSSLVALLLSTMFLLSSTGPQMVSDTLISTDMLSNPRYSLTFPALKSIKAMDDDSVIAIGSSIIRAATDGECISANLEHENTGVYNLGISGAIPYTEILQIPALIAAEPELVIIDLGPNGLAEVLADNPDRDEYIQFRFTINSIAMENDDIGNWTDLIREKDKQWIALNDYERAKLTQEYSQRSVEYSLESLIHENFELVEFEQIAPLPGDDDWQEYLMKPYFREPYMEEMTDEEVHSYFEDNMARIATWPIYNSKNNGTLNHQSYEYMIKELTSSDIPVLLLATPHHPYVYPYLSPGQLDNFNATFERYSNYDGVQGLNMYWETWHSSMFRDRNHLGINGREYFCERIAPVIDGILESENISQIDLNTGFVNLSNYLEDGCEGNEVLYSIEKRYEFIQAENFSNCAWGDGVSYQDNWLLQNSSESQGGSHLQALPEDHSQAYEGAGSRLDYELQFSQNETYYIWVKTKGNSYTNDTIALSWKELDGEYQPIELYDAFGWSSDGQWEWEPEITWDEQTPMTINSTGNGRVTLSIWMIDDGVLIDEILVTTDDDLKPKSSDPHELTNWPIECKGNEVLYSIENRYEFIQAEDFSNCAWGEGMSYQDSWHLQNSSESQGGSHLQALPEDNTQAYEGAGSRLDYELQFSQNETYYIWVKTKGNSYGNDTIALSWKSLDGEYQPIELYDAFGWSTDGQWEWEPEFTFDEQRPMTINPTGNGRVTLSIWMIDDGVLIDEILVTTDDDLKPKSSDPHELTNRPIECKGNNVTTEVGIGNTTIEAENYSNCNYGEDRSSHHQWIEIADINSSNGAYLIGLPDQNMNTHENFYGPSLEYEIQFSAPGTYYVWISMRGNSYQNDTIGLSWEENVSTENITEISSFAWNSYGQWEWEPQSVGVLLSITVTNQEYATLTIWMREDGVQFDRLIITSDENFDPYGDD